MTLLRTFPLLAALAGCGGGDDLPELVPVTGAVTLDGAPLPDAQVTFTPLLKGAASFATTDPDGRFTLMYNLDAAGAVPGSHLVRVSKMTEEAGADLVPARYNERSDLTYEVVAGGTNDFPIELVSRRR